MAVAFIDSSSEDAPSCRLPLIISAIFGGLCLLALCATSPRLAMVWDEGDAIVRAEGISRGVWEYTTHREGHPAFYGLVIAVGSQIAKPWTDPLSAARFGPMLLFSLAAGAMCYRLWREFNPVAGITGVATLLLIPRMFAHAHFASFDGPLTSCWILTWALFSPTRRNLWWVIGWGAVLGMTLSCKATGWIAPFPFLIWTLIYRDRNGLRTVAIGTVVALAVFFVLNPPLWHAPVEGWIRFFNLNFNRANNELNLNFNIPTQFLGDIYHLRRPLPWYNTLFYTVITVPLGLLLLFITGVVTVLRRYREEPLGMLVALNWIILVVVRALPGVPPHDGIRLFLPSFAFLAALSGIGAAGMMALLSQRCRTRLARWTVKSLAVVLVYFGSLSSLVWYAPQWLSYYNILIGGLPGATAVGMEPTYYWDGLDDSVWRWLHEHTAPGEAIGFGASPDTNLRLLGEWNAHGRSISTWSPVYRKSRLATPARLAWGEFRWYVLQHRPSGLSPTDREIMANVPPHYVKKIRETGKGPWRLDVPIVSVYDGSEVATMISSRRDAKP